MSAGLPLVDRDLAGLAPRFRDAVEAAITECVATGFDAFVYEARRSEELQALYYARGRTVIPPEKPVTNARSALYSWHGYGLAVDVISQRYGWDKPWRWWQNVAEIFKRHDCKWGGDWTHPDPPHHQWGRCKASPSERAREILAREGIEAVWAACGAL